MLRRELLRLLTSLPFLGHRRAWLASRPGQGQDAPNAAAVYRRAFAWLDNVPREEWAAAREALDAPKLPPQVDRCLEAARPALAALRGAAEVHECRWGDEAMRFGFIGRGRLKIRNRHLVRLACLSARRPAEAMQFNAALDDAFAALLFARPVGDGGPMIARLFECGDEIATYQALSRILPLLDRPALDSLSRRPPRRSAPSRGSSWP